MAINAYSVNVPIRESRNTYVPLPFEEMYAAMMEKQKRYDVADAYERQAKKEMSSLTSPISGHNEYLQKNIKEPFLQQAMALHNSMPDKGSSEYQRKLNELVDSYMSNPNLNLIKQSALEYNKFVETSAEQMAKGLYSNAAARPYKNFTGFNADGTLAKFQFMGIRPKKDVDAIINDIVAKIPANKTSIEYTTINGRKVGKSVQVKDWKTIYTAIRNRTDSDPDLLADAMDQYNALDPKDFHNIMKIKSQTEAVRNVDEVYGYDAGLMRLAQERKDAEAAQQQQIQAAYHVGDYDDDYNKKVLTQVEDYLDANGNIKPASISAPQPWASPAGEPGERAFRAAQALAGNDMYKKLAERRAGYNLTSTASAKERMNYSKKKLLENPEFKAMVDNYMHAGLSQDAAIKKAGQDLRKMPYSSKRMEGRLITDKDERMVLSKSLQGLGQSLSFYDYNNPTKGGPKSLETILSETGQDDLTNIEVGAEVAPIAGLKGNQNYLVTLGGKSYIASMDSPYPDRIQSKMLFDAQRNKTSLRLKKYHPELDNNTENESLRQDAARYGTDNVIIYTGLDGKLHLKREK